MTLSRRILPLVLAATGVTLLHADPTPSDLGRGHLWLESGRMDIQEPVRTWGFDREGYLALEGYGRTRETIFLGGAIGWLTTHRAFTLGGERIGDLRFRWAELNVKKVFPLGAGFSAGVGGGGSFFYVRGNEVTRGFSPLLDVGAGAQLLVDVDWRVHRLVLGLSARYQWAFDVFTFDYSNFRYGLHAGVVF